MHLEHLWLTHFRSYEEAEFVPAPSGITVVTGANGAGKTNLIEAIGYLSTLRSLRSSPAEALVMSGYPTAVIRSVIGNSETGRSATIEAEMHAAGRDRVKVQGQWLRRTRDLLGTLRVTVFSPDDLALVKAGPAGRRQYLDDLVVALTPRHDTLFTDLEQVLRQRNALLKSAFSSGWRPGRTLAQEISLTLDVLDAKLASTGEQIVQARRDVVARLAPLVAEAYRQLAGGSAGPGRLDAIARYQVSWPGPLAEALLAARDDDLRRGVTTVGPQRDDLDLIVGDWPARTHASQGEQRTLALGLRLAGHRLVAARNGSAPVLLLDDVFSELDRARTEALVEHLPPGQAVLTTAGTLPPGAVVAAQVRVEAGKLLT